MKNLSGLSTIWVILLVLLALGVGVLGGYLVFNYLANKTTTASIPNATKTTTPTSTTSATSTSTSTPTGFNEVTAKQEVCKAIFPNCKTSVSDAKINECLCQIDKITEQFALGNNSTKVDESGGPGAAFLAANVGGSWVLVQTTQDMWLCAKLKQYNVPKSFLGATQCYDEATQKAIDY